MPDPEMITSEDIRRLEREATVPSSELMQTAGKAVADSIREKTDVKNKTVLVACYHGNNGGDGFVTAQDLSSEAEVHVLFLGEEEKLGKDAAVYFKRVKNNPLIQFVPFEEIDFSDYDIIVDAVLGLGARGKLKPEMAAVVKKINEARGLKVSVDVPTGIHPDTGKVDELAVEPDLIVTFHDTKPGLRSMKEKVKIVDIGL